MVIEIDAKELKMIVIALERSYSHRMMGLEMVKNSGDRGMEHDHEVFPILFLANKLRGIYEQRTTDL
jgi:hypothetical protein